MRLSVGEITKTLHRLSHAAVATAARGSHGDDISPRENSDRPYSRDDRNAGVDAIRVPPYLLRMCMCTRLYTATSCIRIYARNTAANLEREMGRCTARASAVVHARLDINRSRETNERASYRPTTRGNDRFTFFL